MSSCITTILVPRSTVLHRFCGANSARMMIPRFSSSLLDLYVTTTFPTTRTMATTTSATAATHQQPYNYTKSTMSVLGAGWVLPFQLSKQTQQPLLIHQFFWKRMQALLRWNAAPPPSRTTTTTTPIQQLRTTATVDTTTLVQNERLAKTLFRLLGGQQPAVQRNALEGCNNVGTTTTATTGMMDSTAAAAAAAATAIWYIKRTFQPSIIRKKRKMGYLVRQRTVGGRRTLARRRAKGRARLGGGI